ncbi:hypothetical protein PVAP13_6KG297600 [Panicum virgatum]|uniref:Response regulatory domain-containing protein n=1 Tax=Panicum virgatum TaxID=38727 RepID=A0A8T0REL6_PANVG|nr:hypothetical protein PVAP13_6KG297600 [Panicum virgatum]
MMSIFFTSRIRVLVVDDDAQFLKSSSTVLSALNYKVTTCGSPISALQVLTRNKLDAVLTNAFSAVACGFDFRASVESNLGIPVLYFLPLPREGSGEEADQLLRRLPPATYAIREPPYEHDMRPLRWVFAWRKCCLDAKVKQAARIPTAIVGDLMAGSTTDEEREDEEEERVQFKVVRASGRGRKRKASSNPGSSSGASLAGDHPGQRQQQMNAIEGQERDNMASNQQQERRGPRAKKNKGKAPQFQEPQAMDGRQLGQQQQQQQMSLLLQSLLHSLDVPPYNPGMFADAAGPSNNVAACAGASNAAAPPPAMPPPRPVYPAPAPAPRPVYPVPAPMPPLPPVNPIPAPMPPVYPVPAPALPFAHQSLQPPMAQQGMFVPWRYGNGNGNGNGSIMLSFQGPPAGDLFTGVGTFGASAAATNLLGGDDHDELSAMATMYPGLFNPPLAPQHVGAASDEAAIAALYSNNYCAGSLMAPQHIGHGAAAAANEEEEDKEALIIDGYINYNTAQFMAPQQVEFDHGVAPGEAAAMEEALNSISFSSGSSSLAPDQILGMASNVNEQAIAGGAFSDNAAASFVEPQNLVVAAPNGNNQLAPGALGDDDLNRDGSLMGSQGLGLHGAAVDGDDAGFSAMFPADQYEANTMFSLEDLLGLDDSPMSEAGQELNGQQGGATGGAAAAAAATGAAGTSPAGGEGGKATWDIEDDGDSDILDDLLLGDLWDNYRTSSDENNGHK